MMQVCTVVSGQAVVTDSGRPLRPSQTTKAHVSHASIFDLGEHRQPELGALTAVTGAAPQDVALAVDGHRDRHVDRPVGDLPVADLHHDRVDEDHRIDPAVSIGGRELAGVAGCE
jgi:hypothetical protein